MVRPILIAALIGAVAPPAWSQTTPAAQAAPQTAPKPVDPYAPTDPAELEVWLRARGETYHRAADEAQDPAELERTAGLNAGIVEANDRAEARDRAAAADYDAARAKYEAAASAAATAQLNYEADLRAAEAAQAQYERDQAQWRARVAACNAGDRNACGPAY